MILKNDQAREWLKANSRHFSAAELECKCGCGAMAIDTDLIPLLENLRAQLGKPVTITSGTRCAKRNAAEGGKTVSEHLSGQAVDVALARPARVFPGTVAEIVSEVDAASRTQLVKVHLDGVAGDVLPGTFGRLWVDAEPREAVFVPAAAVARIGQLAFVQVVRDGRAFRRLVKTGPARGDQIEILSGLRVGDVILATPVQEG